MIVNGLLRRAENLSQISTRIKTRIEKLKSNGVDVSVALSLVVKADASIVDAKASANKAKDGIANGGTIETILR